MVRRQQNWFESKWKENNDYFQRSWRGKLKLEGEEIIAVNMYKEYLSI